MKKLILMAVLVISSATAFAQHSKGSLTIQPKIGLNVANLTDAEGTDPRLGLALGAEFEYAASPMIGLSFGAIYSMQGAKGDASYGGMDADGTVKLDYINVPLLVNVYVTRGLAVKLGLQPGFKVNSEVTVKSGSSSASDSFSANSVDLAIPIGLSYEFNNFVVEGRYNWGVTKFADWTDSKNSVLQFTLGYKFDL